VHDNNTGLGIAGHRLERLDALRAFAKAKGTAPNDFQTQLEFIDQELNSTESKAGEAVRAATTPQQAAAAFIHFERPLGYDPANVAAAHGYGEPGSAGDAAGRRRGPDHRRRHHVHRQGEHAGGQARQRRCRCAIVKAWATRTTRCCRPSSGSTTC
jgi:hypothetical protein